MLGSEGGGQVEQSHFYQLINGSAIYEEELSRSNLVGMMGGNTLNCYVNEIFRRTQNKTLVKRQTREVRSQV